MIRKMHTNRIAPMVERGYREGTKFQWVRETTINAIEAGATKIEFGVEWQAVKTKGVYRRMIADNGKGMSPEELQEFFNCFGGGGKPIGDEHENFGIGAKTALLPWNHHGVVVISWVDGQPAMIRIMRDETTEEYGLQIFEAENDEGDERREAVVEPYNDLEHGVDWREVKPSWIDQHGTVVVLLGNHPDDDTFRGDLSRDEDGTKDIAQYLNHRLWDLKDRAQISAVEFPTTNKANWPKSEPRRKGGVVETGVIVRSVRGTKHYIANATLFAGATLESGAVKLKGNTEIDWYLWSGDPARHHPTPRAGSISVLYRDELYNNQSHHSIYRMFGISENDVRRNLWLVVRPPELDKQAKSGVYPRAARDTLQWFGGRELPLSDWGQQFADQLPMPIVHALRKARGERSGSIDDDAWKEQLAQRFGSLWKVPRYRTDLESPKQAGRATIIELLPIDRPRPVPPPPRPPRPHKPVVPSNKPKFMPVGQAANAKKTMIKGGLPDYEITRDENAVEPGMLAAYTRPNMDKPTGLIVIYGEHPVLRHIVETYQAQYAPHLADDVRKVIEDVYGQVAVAKIAHSEEMRGLVDREVIDRQLRSPEALTMALLGLMAEDCLIRQRLSKTIGKRRRAEAA